VVEALRGLPWLAHVGAPLAADGTIVAVPSWEIALCVLRERPQDTPWGQLRATVVRVADAIAEPPYRDNWDRACVAATDLGDLDTVVGDRVPAPYRGQVAESIIETVKLAIAEIVAADVVEPSYFRDCLTWLHAGRFPCGWEGSWPGGC
jgi:hypothetical protein